MEEFIVLLLFAQKQQGNSNNSLVLQTLDEIKAELAQIKSQLNAQTNMQINPLTITPSYGHTGTWNVQLSGFTNITDNDNSTATNYGEINAASNSVGYFIIDLGVAVNAPFSIIEFLISIQNTNSASAYWGLEIEQQGVWSNIWGEYRTASNNSDTQILKTLVVQASWQRIRFTLKDTGTYAPKIKIYSLRVFTIN